MEILHGFANIASGFSLTCMQGRDTGSEEVETRSDFSVLQNLLNIRQEIKQYLAWENESLGFDLLLSVAIHWNVLTDGGKCILSFYSYCLCQRSYLRCGSRNIHSFLILCHGKLDPSAPQLVQLVRRWLKNQEKFIYVRPWNTCFSITELQFAYLSVQQFI